MYLFIDGIRMKVLRDRIIPEGYLTWIPTSPVGPGTDRQRHPQKGRKMTWLCWFGMQMSASANNYNAMYWWYGRYSDRLSARQLDRLFILEYGE